MSTATQPLTAARTRPAGLVRDLSELVKARVTTLIMITAWCGYFFGAIKSGVPVVSWTLLNAVLGIGIVSGGTAAWNEIMERDSDALMRRTAIRPLVTHSMSLGRAIALATLLTFGGATYLALTCNLLTAALSLATSAVYLFAYTPLKKIGPYCTFVGAFPGAMPGVLGWTAIRGHLEWEAFALFAILFFWQFPHFHSIALMYRDDYEHAGIKMLPVVEPDGRSTARAIMLYGAALLPVSFAPVLMGMTGVWYLFASAALGLTLFYFCAKVWREALPVSSPQSRVLARHLLRATVIYLPVLFAFMMFNARR